MVHSKNLTKGTLNKGLKLGSTQNVGLRYPDILGNKYTFVAQEVLHSFHFIQTTQLEFLDFVVLGI